MTRHFLSRCAIGVITLSLVLAGAPVARAVTLTVSNASGSAGQIVDVGISTSDLTGLGVTAFQFDITYSANIITATDVIESGALVGAAGWGDAKFRVSTGRISISHAGTTALGGTGTLLWVRFVVAPGQLTGTTVGLTMANALLNEGVPAVTTVNGTLTVTATPSFSMSPKSAEIVRDGTQAFTLSGTYVNPLAWSTTDAQVATISSTGILTGLAPGSVRVIAVDHTGVRDTSGGFVQVRGMGLSLGATSVVLGNTVDVAIRVTRLNGLDLHSGEFVLAFDPARLTAQSILTPARSLLAGYGPTSFGATSGLCRVAFAGSSPLVGTSMPNILDTLCTVRFLASGPNTGSTAVTPTIGLFDEGLPARLTPANITIIPQAVLSIAPDVVSLLAGQTQQFAVTGGATAPITWSVLDTSLARIDANGLLTARKGGVTRVMVRDAVGANDLGASVTINDLSVALDTVNVPPGGVVRVPLLASRTLGGLAIRSMQYRVSWSSPYITQVRSLPIGAVYLWGTSNIEARSTTQSIDVAAAGTISLNFAGPDVHVLEFTIAPGAPSNVSIDLQLSEFLFNEGTPAVQTGNGRIQVRASTDVDDALPQAAALGPAIPSPMRDRTRISFALPAASQDRTPVRLAVYGIDGRRVRTLWDVPVSAGRHAVEWDGTDLAGRHVAAGPYFYRLDWPGGSIARRVVLVR